MNLTITKAPESKYKLFPVASELIPEGVKTITFEEQVFEIVDKYTFYKKSFFPTGFMSFVFGKEVEPRLIWETYNKSDSLVVFICLPIEEQNEENEEENVPSIMGN